MHITDDLELPLVRQVIDGPAVRALAERKEDNNNAVATVARFNSKFAPVKGRALAGLKKLSSATC